LLCWQHIQHGTSQAKRLMHMRSHFMLRQLVWVKHASECVAQQTYAFVAPAVGCVDKLLQHRPMTDGMQYVA
jgi:hypothetical protein